MVRSSDRLEKPGLCVVQPRRAAFALSSLGTRRSVVQIHSPRLVVTTTWLSGVRSAATAVVQILAPTRSDRDLSFRYQVPLPLPLPLLTPCPWSPGTSTTLCCNPTDPPCAA